MINTKIQANSLDFGHISWKSYNLVKKKAMEQRFSWSGLLISLSIAFFIVVACAQSLNMIHQSMINEQNQQQFNRQLYRLENFNNINNSNNYLYTEYIDSEKRKYLPQGNLAVKTINNYFI